MKKLNFLALMFCFAGSCLGQQSGMFPQYDSYVSYTMDSNFNVYQTVVVEGTTTGSCTYVCGPGGVTCTIPGCPSALHTPTINNVIGGVGGWTTGAASNPFSYMSYQTTNHVQIQPGHSVPVSWEGDVSCTILGSTFFGSGGGGWAGASETNYSYAPPPHGGACAYAKNCPVGQTATCGVGTIYKAMPCSPQFIELFYIWYNFGGGPHCIPFGAGIGSNIPGNCD